MESEDPSVAVTEAHLARILEILIGNTDAPVSSGTTTVTVGKLLPSQRANHAGSVAAYRPVSPIQNRSTGRSREIAPW